MLCSLEKYMEIRVSENLIKDKILSDDEVFSIDFSNDANIFYTYSSVEKKYCRVKQDDFDRNDIILRLLHWSRGIYYMRILKVNKNQTVDFGEEIKHLKYVNNFQF